MILLSKNSATFIVRIWMEPREIEGEPPEWRGMIEHLESHEKKYFHSLEVLASFIRQRTDFKKAEE